MLFWGVIASLHCAICAICNLSLFLFPSPFWAVQNVTLLCFSGKMGPTEREGVSVTETAKLRCSWWTRLQSCTGGMCTYSWNSTSYCSNTGHSASQKLRFVNVVARDTWLWAGIPTETLLGSTWRAGRKSRKKKNKLWTEERIIKEWNKEREHFKKNTALAKAWRC